MISTIIRLGLRDKAARKKVEESIGHEVDWDKLAEEEPAFSKQLRELVPRLPFPTRAVRTPR